MVVLAKVLVDKEHAAFRKLVALADRAANENLSSEEIKKSIKQWRADNYRV